MSDLWRGIYSLLSAKNKGAVGPVCHIEGVKGVTFITLVIEMAIFLIPQDLWNICLFVCDM